MFGFSQSQMENVPFLSSTEQLGILVQYTLQRADFPKKLTLLWMFTAFCPQEPASPER